MQPLLLLRLSKRKSGSPFLLVVILSNLGQREDIEKGLALGANDYIVKAHSTPSEVLRKIETLLEKKA